MTAISEALRERSSGYEVAEPVESWRTAAGAPEAVVFPRSSEEVAEVLSEASSRGWTVLPCGNGSWLDGLAVPGKVDVVMSMSRLTEITRYEPADLTLTCGAGLSFGGLTGAAGSHRQWFPFDSTADASVGAFLSLGIGGPLLAGYGRPRDQILGAEVVTGDGRILRLGGQVVKNVAGYDLLRLMIGSRGSLSVVTSATIRLFPLPEVDLTLRIEAEGISHASEILHAIRESPFLPAALELVDDSLIDEGDGQSVLVRLHGSADTAEEIARRLGDRVAAKISRFEALGSAALWKRLLRAEESPGCVVIRLSGLPSRANHVLERVDEAVRQLRGRLPKPAYRSGWALHVTAGALRWILSRTDGQPWGSEVQAWSGTIAELRAELESVGGSLTVLQAPSPLLSEVGVWGNSGPQRRLLMGLKQAFDPAGILAPGRLPI